MSGEKTDNVEKKATAPVISAGADGAEPSITAAYGARGSAEDPEKAYRYVDTTNGNLIMNCALRV